MSFDNVAKYTLYRRMYMAMRELGAKRAFAFAQLIAAGYDRELKTLEEQVRRLASTGQALLGTENVGREAILIESEMKFFKDWIAEKNSRNEDFDTSDVQRTN